MVYADIYTDLKLANKTKIIHIMVSLLIIIILFLLTDSPQKLKLEKIHEALTILFYVSPAWGVLSYKDFSFFIKNTKK